MLKAFHHFIAGQIRQRLTTIASAQLINVAEGLAMGTRTLGFVAALGMLAPLAAHADLPAGDIVDQILKTLPPAPGQPAPSPVPVTSPPPSTVAMSATPPNLGPASPAPVSSEPLTPAPGSSAPPSPPPDAAVAAPNKGDILVQAGQTPPAPIDASATDSSGQWTGFYLGGNLGYGLTRGGSGETCLNSLTGSSTGCDIVNSPALHTGGVLGGGQIGYLMPLSALNLNLGNTPLMIGVEADIQGTGIDKTQNVSGPFNFVGIPGASCSPCNFTASQQIGWFGTVRGRIGIPVDNLFFYGTGGVMYGSIKASQSLNFTGSPQGNVVAVSKGTAGPTVGAGVEVLLGGPFSAKFEGLYYDLGSLHTASVPVGGAPGNFTDFKTFGFRGMLFRLGVNVKLGGLGGT